MSTGLLEVRGSFAVAQFWPNGSADADTVSIILATDGPPFRFQCSPDARWQVTTVFDGALVDGAVKKAPISAKRKLTIRLIGIDAPELHCGATARIKKSKRTAEQLVLFQEFGKEYRQPFAESAVLALVERLGGTGKVLPATVRTRVDQPNEVFDCYGRFVGDMFVQLDGVEFHVNRWLMEQGWAVPSLYDSMAEDEIEPIVAAANDAYAKSIGIWQSLSDGVTELDWAMRYRRLHAAPGADGGLVLYPKFYRRLVTWAVNKRAKMSNGTFIQYLHDVNERCVDLDEYLQKGQDATLYRLSDFVGDDGSRLAWPEEIVFREKDSTLIGAGGGRVVAW